MMLGLSLPTLTLVHIAISLIGLAAGFGVLYSFVVSFVMRAALAVRRFHPEARGTARLRHA